MAGGGKAPGACSESAPPGEQGIVVTPKLGGGRSWGRSVIGPGQRPAATPTVAFSDLESLGPYETTVFDVASVLSRARRPPNRP